ncbi:uncharacterized protein AMSG_01593 [Thecamonas trahens ATCC 50062]|uniref:Uncharacterized protein n=1 Tax=Thecamonas trahens ATCC 50062 TaxID=461836 RepID=A0A0L0DR35_THETB|nr:hypothetical protein AMSG_01593 [Thecamonas trahens ATCC 50062]KNC54742.1 hypothetical protein AMSG_01593 [Thecamonas trahens ATCC 50062]|eukprot:XP_013761642.1 hypothetical protein AMSG_01593 [Thecamonas trahens ATCC 50062]
MLRAAPTLQAPALLLLRRAAGSAPAVRPPPSSAAAQVEATSAVISAVHALLETLPESAAATRHAHILQAAQGSLPKPAEPVIPTALVVGDRNVGKTALVAALTSARTASSTRTAKTAEAAAEAAALLSSTSALALTPASEAHSDSPAAQLGFNVLDTPPLGEWPALLGDEAAAQLLPLAEIVLLVTDPARQGKSSTESATLRTLDSSRLAVALNKADMVEGEQTRARLRELVAGATGADLASVVLTVATSPHVDDSGLPALTAVLERLAAPDALMDKVVTVRLDAVAAALDTVSDGLALERRVLARKEDEILRLTHYVEDEAADLVDTFSSQTLPLVTDHFDSLVEKEKAFFQSRTVLDLLRLSDAQLRLELAEERLFTSAWLAPIETSLASSMAATLETARHERVYMLESLTQFAADPAMRDFPLTRKLREALAAAHANHSPATFDKDALVAKLSAMASAYDRAEFEDDAAASMRSASRINYMAQLGSASLLTGAWGYTQLAAAGVDMSVLSSLVAAAGASSFGGLWWLQSTWMGLEARLATALRTLRADLISSLPDVYSSVVRRALKPAKKTLAKCYSAATEVGTELASLEAARDDAAARVDQIRTSLRNSSGPN